MSRQALEKFINEHSESDDFTGGVDQDKIEFIQNKLGAKLPKSYKWFLANYGSGGIFGVDILGFAKSNIASVVIETERYRKLGLESHLVVVENCDEYMYCLNTSEMAGEECPVTVWDRHAGLDDFNEADNFYDFLFERLTEAKDNCDEDF
ncbi:SUKH superfamily protein [Scopulibacillus darangshiensis]|uniref:SUKH superfamily protein n=1 Tax=Scopulibacillus darangshiensis TaxID=442528 RepID=A0A4R2NFR6_9BACL|nr:SMI1/KNR4 family protein [Scopulibacillus darangshiensis]TCP19944.1 SUKH superfamily protein [Scopulibacillus darangshiensis]